MYLVHPLDLLGRFYGRDVEIYDDRLLPATHDNTFERLICISIDLLVRDKRRNINKVTRSGFSGEFETITPAHPRSSFDDVNHAFKFAVMMGSGLCVGVDGDGARPELRGARPCVRDRGS